jgi:hypothetical protein
MDSKITKERKVRSDKLLEEHRAKNPRAVVLAADDDMIVVAPPTRAQWRQFKAAAADDRKRADSLELLVLSCLLHPDVAALEAMFERRAALPEVFAEQVLALAGAGADVQKND